MNNLIAIRKKLDISQKQLGDAVGVSQTGVSYYESCGGDPSVAVAKKIIEFAKREKGVVITLDEIYADPDDGQSSNDQRVSAKA